ncbi:MAG: signal peptide peptidase SppA [Syntrophobacteraceae bacterium]|jgi:protease-4|nr:signal peptide peptidase SppA [Syntrophobacteraceae bacterium]
MRRKLFWIVVIVSVFLGVMGWLGSSDFDFMASPNRIGVIEVRGSITNVRSHLSALKRFRKDPNTKAIILRIESPGGGIAPSQELYREIRRTRAEKPILASMGAVAASGGYYIAAPASRIFASPGTITGSIGVISHFPNLRELFQKIGVQTVTIKSGSFKDVGNPGREMTTEEKDLLQETLDQAHQQFVRDVAEGRSMPEERVRPIADGRILMGETALALGLIDELGNFEDAVLAATALGGIEGEPRLVHAKKEQRSFLDLLMGDEVSEKIASWLKGPEGYLQYELPSPSWTLGDR